MKIHRCFTVLVLLGSTLLGACANPHLRLYDGTPRPASEIAVIRLPEALEVIRINGQDIKGARGSFNKGEKTIDIAPGRYELLVYYREIWELGGQHDALRSNPVLFVVDAAAGQTYRIGYAQPRTYDAARQLAADFRGWSEDANGQRQPSQASGLKFRDGLMAQFSGSDDLVPDTRARQAGGGQVVAPLASGAPPSAAGPQPTPQGERDWLSLMQGWWQQASADERRAFLRWVAEQP